MTSHFRRLVPAEPPPEASPLLDSSPAKPRRISTGISGLDQVMGGGLIPGSGMLVVGGPGTGKTILGLQFLYSAALDGEPGAYLTFEELPEQIYEDTLGLGWDLQERERKKLLRVVCTSPALFLREILEPEGLLDELVSELAVKRIVLDSLAVLRWSEGQQRSRQSLYTLRNVLRKHRLTAVVLDETEAAPGSGSVAPFLFDTHVRLDFSETTGTWSRGLQVLKHRGGAFLAGRHLFHIVPGRGIDLVPARTVPPLRAMALDAEQLVPTGLPPLDVALRGGLPHGSTFVFNTNGRANYHNLVAAIMAQHVARGYGVIVLPSSLSSAEDWERTMLRFGIGLQELGEEGRLVYIEHYDRPVPAPLEPYTIRAAGLANGKFEAEVRARANAAMRADPQRRWFIYYDMNTILSERGLQYLRTSFTSAAARVKAAGATMLAFCNFAEMPAEAASFLERTSHGVIRTWVDGAYQFVQLAKSPSGGISEPFIVVGSDWPPFVELR